MLLFLILLLCHLIARGPVEASSVASSNDTKLLSAKRCVHAVHARARSGAPDWCPSLLRSRVAYYCVYERKRKKSTVLILSRQVNN